MKKLVPYFTPDGRRVAPRGPVILSVVLAVVVVVLAAVSIRLCFTRAELLAQVEDLETQLYRKGQDYANAQADYNEAESLIESMHAVLDDNLDAISYLSAHAMVFDFMAREIVPGSGLYHRVGCPISRGKTNLMGFDYAERLGYQPCSYCCGEDSKLAQEFMDNYNSVLNLSKLIRNGSDTDWYLQGLLLE